MAHGTEETVASTLEKMEEIELHQKELPVTNQIMNEFLFLTQEHSNNVSLFYSKTVPTYILNGRKKAKIVPLNPTNQ